jgi:hypothetical protein
MDLGSVSDPPASAGQLGIMEQYHVILASCGVVASWSFLAAEKNPLIAIKQRNSM